MRMGGHGGGKRERRRGRAWSAYTFVRTGEEDKSKFLAKAAQSNSAQIRSLSK